MSTNPPRSPGDEALKHVLVVVEDREFAGRVDALLARRGYHVASASTIDEARALADTFDAGLVLVDVRLGREDSLNLVTELKARRPDVLCVVITAQADIDAAVRAFQAGAYDYVRKPISPPVLFATVERCFERLSLGEEKVRATGALRTSESLMRSIFRAAPIGIGLVVDRVFKQANERLCEMLGYSEEELVGQSARLIYPTEEEFKYVGREKYAQIRQQGIGMVETRWQRKDGTLLDVLLSSAPLDPADLAAGVTFTALDITEQRRNQEARRVAERERAAVLDNMSEMVLYQDVDGKILWANRAAAESVGMTPEALAGHYCFDVRHGRRERCEDCPTPGALESGQPMRREVVTSDGRRLQVRVYPVRNAEDRVEGIVEVAHDVTEHRQVEEALRQERDRAQTYLDVAEVILLAIDVHGRVALINRKGCNALGYTTEDEILGRDWFDEFLPERIREQTRRVNRQVMSGDIAPFEYHENPVLTKSGDERLIAWHNTILRDEAGNISMSLSSGEDITERRKAEEALRESEEKYRCIVENSRDIIMLTQPDGVITYLSPACESVLGYAPEELVRAVPEVFHPDDRDRIQAAFRQARRGESGSQLEYRIITKQGETKWISHSWSPVASDGNLELIVSVIRDITERKAAEQERRALEDQLRQAQKMEALGAMAAGVAHDLNNVLTAIMNYAAVARAAPTNESRVTEAAERITQAVDQATGLTRSLLTFSRRATTDKGPVHLGKVVSAAVALLQRMLPAAIDMNTDLSTSAPGLWVNADSTQLQQVVMNLAVNARDAMPDGGQLRIAVAHRGVHSSDVLSAVATRGMGAAVLIVEDTGTGMSDEVRARLFEPFFTTKAREHGTGLGMAIVHGIVVDHQGTIQIDSGVGQGTRIEVAFPCCAPGDPVDHVASCAPRQHGRGQTILLAEDNEAVRTLVASSLRSLNYDVIECKDGADALAVFEQRRTTISAVILDVDLPKKSGTACLTQMRAAYPELPAVVVTGSVGPRIDELRDTRTRALYKPFLVTELARQLTEVLDPSDRRAAQP